MRYVFDTNAIISPDLLTLDPLLRHRNRDAHGLPWTRRPIMTVGPGGSPAAFWSRYYVAPLRSDR